MHSDDRCGGFCVFKPPQNVAFAVNLVGFCISKKKTGTVRTSENSRHAKIPKTTLFKIRVVRTNQANPTPVEITMPNTCSYYCAEFKERRIDWKNRTSGLFGAGPSAGCNLNVSAEVLLTNQLTGCRFFGMATIECYAG